MTQLLSSLQKLYESKILEADHQIKHYSTNALAVADHSEFTKEIDKQIVSAVIDDDDAINTINNEIDNSTTAIGQFDTPSIEGQELAEE